MRYVSGALLLAALVMGAANAEPLGSKAAKKMLFSTKGVTIEVVEDSGLDPLSLTVVGTMVQDDAFKDRVIYYGALAFSPAFIARVQAGDGDVLDSGLANYVDGFHSIGAAEQVALAGCEKGRRTSEAACVIAIRVLPKRYESRALTLSTNATQAFRNFRKGSGPKAFAISASSISFAIAKGEGASGTALATCNERASETGSPDCEVVIAD